MDHARRVERVGDVFRRIARPLDDIDLFGLQFIYHVFHAHAARAHAGTHRVDHGIVGMHGHLGAVTGFARDGANLHRAGADLRHFQLEQSLDQPRMRARNRDLRAARAARHVEHIHL